MTRRPCSSGRRFHPRLFGLRYGGGPGERVAAFETIAEDVVDADEQRYKTVYTETAENLQYQRCQILRY